MPKKIIYIPCIICGVAKKAMNHSAIVTVCKKCRTDENLNKIKSMSLEDMINYKTAWLQKNKIKKENSDSNKYKPNKQIISPTIRLEGKKLMNDYGEPI